MADYQISEGQDLRGAIQEAVGAASMAWVGGPGDRVFDDKHALEVAAMLETWIRNRYVPRAAPQPPSEASVAAAGVRVPDSVQIGEGPIVAGPTWYEGTEPDGR
jgi:hypothetical protein